MIGGMVLSAYGQYKAGKAAKKAGEASKAAAFAQADLLDYNAKVDDIQGQDAVDRGRIEEGTLRTQIRQVIGAQRASFAGQNVVVGSGSSADVEADSAYLGELDALQIRQNAMREAFGFKVQAYNSRRRAEVARKEGVVLQDVGNAQATAANIGAAGSILAGTGNLLVTKYGFDRTRPVVPTNAPR
jgi:hypothetical protein